VDQLLGLPRRTGHKPVKINEWDLGLSSRDLGELKAVLELVNDVKRLGVTGAAVARSFFPADDPIDQGSGSPDVRVLGVVGPHA
jgi:hypothetical protein